RRAAGPCIGTTASVCFATRRRCSAARTSTLSCTRWVDRSGHLGRLNTSLLQLRRLRLQGTPRRGQPPDNTYKASSSQVNRLPPGAGKEKTLTNFSLKVHNNTHR